jgi:phosphoribosylformylglycinamidine synthase
MACVVRAEDADKFLALADKENLMATKVAVVTADPRLVMHWRKKKIVDLSREFLNSNGAAKYITVNVEAPEKVGCCGCGCEKSMKERFMDTMTSLNVASQKGLMERFDCTIGSGTVLMPHGGKNQLTPSQVMAAKVSLEKGNTNTVSLMSWGFNPNLSEKSPYHGAMSAVIESVAKIVAAGGSRSKCWLSFQEYFEKVGNNPSKWGKPFSALLGGLKAQLELGVGAIGGKDSMSGNFEELHVPPTLISFAAAVTKLQNVVSN